jgi:flagellar biogenesis protein FliO
VVYQKKRIAFLCLLLLVSGGWIALASRQSGAATEPSSGTGTFSAPEKVPVPNLSLGSGELFLKMMLSVGLVLGLGGAALYVSRRVLPRVTHAAGKEIHVLETACLGPRKALHLVEVAGQRLLIASTSDHVTMLTTVNETWLDLPKAEMAEAVKA